MFDVPHRTARPLLHDVFTSGRGGAHTYRLPNIIVATDGTLLLFVHGRLLSARDVGASAVFLRRSLDGGATWDTPRMVMSDPLNRTMIAQQVVSDPRSGAIVLLANRVPCSRCTAGRSRRDKSRCEGLGVQSAWGSARRTGGGG